MRIDFDKILNIIKNQKNERKHIPAINRIVKNFEMKWKLSKDKKRDIYFKRVQEEMSKLLTRINSL
jgi:hypothetical protein